ARGVTQNRSAEVSGVTQQYVSGLERGRRNPTVVTLYHLATALGVSPVELGMPDNEAPRESARAPKRKSRKKKSAAQKMNERQRERRPARRAERRSPFGSVCAAAGPDESITLTTLD